MKTFYEGQVLTAADLNDNFAEASALPRVASGNVVITPSAANEITSQTVDFPSGRFTATPQIALAINASNPAIAVVSFTSISTSGVQINLTRSNTNPTTVHWIAVQE